MAILIKGMEIPFTCLTCDFHKCAGGVGDFCSLTKRRQFRFKNRPKDCPLTEVPEPHGNLIDADEIFVEFVIEGQRSKRYKLGEKWELNGEEIRSVISRLPTIIPASEGGAE